MNKNKFSPMLSALAGVAALLFMPAQAKQPDPGPMSCADSVRLTGNASYQSCLGVHDGNLAQEQTHSVVFDGVGFGFLAFFGNNGGAGTIDKDAGTLQLATPQSGPFVVGINGGNRYSLYLFDGGDDVIESIAFDTLGVAKPNGEPGPLTHAALFTMGGSPTGPEQDSASTQAPAIAQVPEPGTSGLVLAALAAVGLTARRGKR
jgi:hypothetical protein